MGDYRDQYERKKATAKTMLYDGMRKRQSLDGLWHYGIDQYDTCLRSKWYEEKYYDEDGRQLPVDFSFDEWPVMQLPCCYNMIDRELFLYEGSMVFTRNFLFEKKKGERAILKIGAANYVCRVFLNKQFVGMHRGGSTPAYFDITEYVQKQNRIIITVDNTRHPWQVPMENTDWFNYGGIYRSMELFVVPDVFVKDMSVMLDPKDHSHQTIRAEVALSKQVTGQAQFRILQLGIDMPVEIQEGVGVITVKTEPKLWEPENPVLYDVEVSYEGDVLRDRIGFRDVRVEKNKILLNDKEIFLRGVSCHEDSVTNGKALTEEERIETIRIAKELGCNFMRLAHYPHHENMAKLADEMGLLLWEEVPVYWDIDFDNPATYEDAENQLLELIGRDKNRASVIIWSVGNENLDTESRYLFMSKLVNVAKQADPSRLVSAACLVNG
ncbi:MAG: glycoside hydrolase family 2, partial [Lachnospiraceae bacterium]|nr:glycoside hydrolase family 2 [Lachnospiraceae bacterium]